MHQIADIRYPQFSTLISTIVISWYLKHDVALLWWNKGIPDLEKQNKTKQNISLTSIQSPITDLELCGWDDASSCFYLGGMAPMAF